MKSLLTILLCLTATSLTHAQDKTLDLGGVREEHIMIPMRDGKHLSAWLYFPKGDGPWPAIFEQRYASIEGKRTKLNSAEQAAKGYVVAMVNFRGAQKSEGQWVGYRALAWGELQDGYDTCEWLAKQKWCTGKIGTFGSSQGGFAQNFLAVSAPPHLVCQYMVDTGLSLFQEGYRIGGVTRPERFKGMDKVCRDPADNQKLMKEWFSHPNYDDYWKDEDCSLHFDKMNVPCFTIGSWYDFMNQGSVMSFQGRQHHGGASSKEQQQLLLGPWLHGRLNKNNKTAELTFPENATWPEKDHMTRWFDHYLKGVDNGIEKDPAVRYYVIGAAGEANSKGNVWRETNDWPPASDKTPYYLHAEGKLNTQLPTAEKSTTDYHSDPLHPMEIPGRGFPGARDARKFEQQKEVRTFTSEVLKSATEWTGLVKVVLWFSSSAKDTDVIVRVSDVYPDGRSMLLMDYPRRLRYRDGFNQQVLMKPGEPVKVAYDIGRTSIIFNKGHRIRITIASTGAPLYESNPQTGGPQTIEYPANPVTATNSIHHEKNRASHIIAPVITVK
ncbi:MAG: CocE/NonD family hydrolase [Verrucomicrobiota bacterium]